jgi:hypothetical protein
VNEPAWTKKWAYLTGLRYNALYSQEPWLLELLQQANVKRLLLVGRLLSIGTVSVLIAAFCAFAVGHWALLLAGVAYVPVLAIILWWRVLPGLVEGDRRSFDEPPFDPSSVPSIWRTMWRRGPG